MIQLKRSDVEIFRIEPNHYFATKFASRCRRKPVVAAAQRDGSARVARSGSRKAAPYVRHLQ
jgi:hypothetical protein